MNPQVDLHTSSGLIRVELDADKAPLSAENFLAYVRAGHYDGTVFHRVIPGFVIQGGGFDTAAVQKKTKAPIKNEWQNGLKNKRGTLSMARTSVPDSATSQFFVNLVDNVPLDTPRGGRMAVGDVLETEGGNVGARPAGHRLHLVPGTYKYG